ncbi:MAG: diguanylate cyclase [Gammaproteobacteria bacterium]|nr:diguanylate cyclase [Gammaproteobacteria bacterium]MDH5628683.1 diguanylate cyclase [Gammaproteobacteria bacterium]
MQIPSKKNIILSIIAIIALLELVIMLVFANLSLDIGIFAEAILDVIILVTFSTPLIYLWIIKPYVIARDEALHQVRHMAYHDSLTQLANRRLLTEYLGKLISLSVRDKFYGALLFIDLDGFKKINDSNGHDVGDKILIEVAARLTSLTRNEDIVSRVGGDEFVVVLSETGKDEVKANKEAMRISDRILKELTKEISINDTPHKVGASIGLRLLTPEKISPDVLLNEADLAMYRAKEAGKNRIVVW